MTSKQEVVIEVHAHFYVILSRVIFVEPLLSRYRTILPTTKIFLVLPLTVIPTIPNAWQSICSTSLLAAISRMSCKWNQEGVTFSHSWLLWGPCKLLHVPVTCPFHCWKVSHYVDISSFVHPLQKNMSCFQLSGY